jgi:thioesterase domain-containing protein
MEDATILHLGNLLDQQAPSWPSLIPLQPLGSNPPFFCVHGAGGDAQTFVPLARRFAPDYPIYAIQDPLAYQPDESPPRIEAMAARYVAELRDCQPKGPYFLGGYSLGGSIAFEMAQQLLAQKQEIALLAIIDHPAPGRQRAAWGPGLLADFIRNLYDWTVTVFPEYSWGEIWYRVRENMRVLKKRASGRLTRSAYTSSPADHVKGLFVHFSHFPPELQRTLERHAQALLEYVPGVYPGRVTLFRSRAQPLLRVRGLDRGWAKLAAEGVEVVLVRGSHHSMVKEPHVEDLAEQIKAQIQKRKKHRAAAPHREEGPGIGTVPGQL